MNGIELSAKLSIDGEVSRDISLVIDNVPLSRVLTSVVRSSFANAVVREDWMSGKLVAERLRGDALSSFFIFEGDAPLSMEQGLFGSEDCKISPNEQPTIFLTASQVATEFEISRPAHEPSDDC